MPAGYCKNQEARREWPSTKKKGRRHVLFISSSVLHTNQHNQLAFVEIDFLRLPKIHSLGHMAQINNTGFLSSRVVRFALLILDSTPARVSVDERWLHMSRTRPTTINLAISATHVGDNQIAKCRDGCKSQ